jgi:hypothetical protein
VNFVVCGLTLVEKVHWGMVSAKSRHFAACLPLTLPTRTTLSNVYKANRTHPNVTLYIVLMVLHIQKTLLHCLIVDAAVVVSQESLSRLVSVRR